MLFEQYREDKEKTEECLDTLWEYLSGKLYFGKEDYDPRKSETPQSVKDRPSEAASPKEAA